MMPCPTSPILPVQEAHAQIHPFLPPERPIPKFISKKQATQKKSCNPRRLSSYAQRTSSPRKKNSPWANGFGRIGGRAGTTGAGAGITGKAGGVSTSGNAHSPTKNNRQNLCNFYIFAVPGKIGLKWGQEFFFFPY